MVNLDTPLDGLARAQTSFDQAAAKIAQPVSVDQNPQDQVSLSDNMVALMQSATDYKANLKSLEVSNDMQKSLLNILA